MARTPEPGRVKTRLARTIGEVAAAEVYRAFLEDLGARLGRSPEWRFLWAYEPADSSFARDLARGAEAFPQTPGDLGARMAGAIGESLRRGFDPVVLVGSDVPHLPATHVAAAIAALGSGADLVLGPVEDGGYCLIGCRSVPDVFTDVTWGTSEVLAQTLDRAARAGLVVERLSELYDVDEIDDLRRLADDIHGGRVRDLAATEGALARLGALRYS
jgi:rSAM/selenodomain-associated transferase 1